MKMVGTIAGWLVVAVVLGIALLRIPEWMANQYPFDNVKDWATQAAANRTLLVNIIGGVALGITIYFTYQNFLLTQNKLDSETFAKAVEQLGSVNISIRLGGVHTLERIARRSEKDYFPVMQVLTGYIRETCSSPVAPTAGQTSPGRFTCPVDIQAILTIVGDRHWPEPTDHGLDLSNSVVRDAWLLKADLSNVYFWRVHFTEVNFSNANLSGADFLEATLDDCDFTDADLSGANFKGAKLPGAVGLTAKQLAKAENVPTGLI